MRFGIIVLFSLVLLLTACGGTTDTSPAELTKSTTFNADNGAITIRYPEDWTIDEAFGQISFVNSADVESLELERITEGIFTGFITVAQSDGASIDELAGQFSAPAEGIPTQEVERFTVNGREGVSLAADDVDSNGTNTRRLTVITAIDDTYMALVTALGTVDTINAEIETIRAVAGGIDFDLLDNDE